MRTTLKISMLLYGLALLAVAGFGVVYFARSSIMPYHEEAIGVPWAELDNGLQALLLGLLKIYGASLIALGIAGFFIVAIPLRNDERWAKIALVAIGLVYGAPALWATLYVRNETGANTPWLASLVGLVLIVVAAVLSFVGGKGHQPATANGE